MNLLDAIAIIGLAAIVAFAIGTVVTRYLNTHLPQVPPGHADWEDDHGIRDWPPRKMPRLPSYSALDNDHGQDDDKIIFRDGDTRPSLLNRDE